MKKLFDKISNKLISDKVEVASSTYQRTVGLLKYQNIESQQGMQILFCNSIHTFFMKFPIDCIFVNKHLEVVKIYENVKPYRIILPIFKASSVFEFSSGFVAKSNIKIGDQFYVGD